jgi:uridine kinase
MFKKTQSSVHENNPKSSFDYNEAFKAENFNKIFTQLNPEKFLDLQKPSYDFNLALRRPKTLNIGKTRNEGFTKRRFKP